MFFKTMLAAALLATPFHAAPARDWRFAGQIPGHVMVFVDINSLETGARPYPKAWTLMVMAEDEDRYAALGALIEYDCEGHRRHGIEAAGYSAEGEVLQTAGVENRWNPQNQSHVLWHAEEVICGRRTLTGKSYGAGVPIAEGRAILGGVEP